MARLEIIIGAFLAGMGIWFSRKAAHLPSSFLSYGDPSFLILKLASSAFLFLGLALMARALILSRDYRDFILKQPLNLMTVALLILVFFLFLPKAGYFSMAALLFPALFLLLFRQTGRSILIPVLSAAFLVFALVGLWAKMAL